MRRVEPPLKVRPLENVIVSVPEPRSSTPPSPTVTFPLGRLATSVNFKTPPFFTRNGAFGSVAVAVFKLAVVPSSTVIRPVLLNVVLESKRNVPPPMRFSLPEPLMMACWDGFVCIVIVVPLLFFVVIEAPTSSSVSTSVT